MIVPSDILVPEGVSDPDYRHDRYWMVDSEGTHDRTFVHKSVLGTRT